MAERSRAGRLISSTGLNTKPEADEAVELLQRIGRNETLNAAPALRHAQRDNSGNMNALLVSLLTSDAFLYRARDEHTTD